MAVSGVGSAPKATAATGPADGGDAAKPAESNDTQASGDAKSGAKAIGDSPKPAEAKAEESKPAESKPKEPAAADKSVAKAVDTKPAATPAATPPAAPKAAAMAGMSADEHAGMAMGGAAKKTMNFGNDSIVPPVRGDSRFADGSTGPIVKDGAAPTLKIADGKGFGGVDGRQQNAGDKAQNNYSVTDANFNNKLGVLATDPDTGKPMNYVQHIQSYNAAGYIETYAPDVYKQLSNNQNNGKGTVLGASLSIMGLTKSGDPALQGVDISKVPMTVPGTNLDARAEVKSAQDGTGQDWARPHHAESHWNALKNLIEAGVDVKTAQEFAGDDAVSGAGRLNGINNQDGTSGFNAGELAVYKKAAAYQQSTGINVLQAMMHAHNMNSVDPSALTNPAINAQLGLGATDRSVSPARIDAIFQGLLNGTVKNNAGNNNGNNNAGNAAANNGGGNGGAAAADGGGGGGGAVTGAGTVNAGTIDEADPIAAFADIAATGFADGIAGPSSTRLALLMQSLLTGAVDGTLELTPELIDQIRVALTALLEQLAASDDPADLALASLLVDTLDALTAANGQINNDVLAALLVTTSELSLASGAIDPEFEALMLSLTGQAPGAGAGQAGQGIQALGAAPAGGGGAAQAAAGAGAQAPAAAPPAQVGRVAAGTAPAAVTKAS